MSDDGRPRPLRPKLRFPEFRDTGDWAQPPLGDYLTESLDAGSSGDTAKKLTVKLWGRGVAKKSEAYKGSENTRYYRRRAGQLIYSKLDFLNGAFGLVPPELDGYESTIDLPCLDIDDALDPDFLLYYVGRPDFYKRFGDIADGGRKAKRIGVEALSTFPITLPPAPAEQRKIAGCLGSLDALVAAEGRKLSAWRAHKRGLMQQLFPRPGQTRPRLRFPEFRNAPAWAVKPFNKLYTFEPNNTFSRDQLNYDGGEYRNIHYGDIHTKFATHFRLDHEHVPFVNNAALPTDVNPRALCQPDDIIFADASEDLADVGKCIEIIDTGGQNVLSGSHTILARRRDDTIRVGFGGYLFRAQQAREQIEKEAQGTKVMQISATRLGTTDVCYPDDEDEQHRIAACLSSLDALLAAQAARVDALRTFKTGLMQQLFPPPSMVG